MVVEYRCEKGIIAMFENLFPINFLAILNKTPVAKINEIRLRIGKRVVICIGSKSYFLGQDGLTGSAERAIKADRELIDFVFKSACENSVYAFSNQIKSGFVTVKGGIRVGIGGEAVVEKGMVKTFKNIGSLSVRIPTEVKGCASKIFGYLFENDFQNTLIVSPPGAGKTTLIRDILLTLSQKNFCYNVLLVDERFEIANCFNGVPMLDVGNFCDILSGVPKSFAFECGIRSLRPDIVATDEISTTKDFEAILRASSCGVKIVATIHAKNVEDLKSKPDFETLFKNKVFKRFVVLSCADGPGTVEGIYDQNLRCISY